jgi:hypothetical protein
LDGGDEMWGMVGENQSEAVSVIFVAMIVLGEISL